MPLKLMTISQTAWRNDNSFGSSYSNIFGNVENLEIANVFCNYGEPENEIVSKYFQITEKYLLKNLKDKNYPSGKEIFVECKSDNLNAKEIKIVDNAKKIRWQILFWTRDLIWRVGRWKSDELINFIDTFDPDVLFFPLYYSSYLNDIALFVKKHTNKRLVCYVSDDIYSLKQFSLSPLYWIDRIWKRTKIKKVVNQCEYLYVISEIQKREYEKIFNKECKVLCKCADFTSEPDNKNNINTPIQMVYTGNIGGGRWRMLGLIGSALKAINAKGTQAQLFIYTMTPITNKMKRTLNIKGSVFLKGGVPSSEIENIQKYADILVHVESFGLKERLQVHQSFSTKIVDYFAASKCIFAVGSMDMASINHLAKNDAAIIATSKNEIFSKLSELVNNPSLVQQYGKNAWECGKRNHQANEIKNSLYEDLVKLWEA